MFLIEITIQVSFTSCCTAKKEKGSNGFFPKIFFSLAQLSYEYISLGFFAGFLFFLLACFLCFLGFCSLVVVFFFRNLGVKNKNIISFSLACFVFWLFFFLSSILFITCKKKLWRVAKFFVVVEGFFGVVLGSSRIRNFFFGELDLIFFWSFFVCLDFGCTIVIPSF